MLSRLWPNFSRRYNFFWLWNHWSCYYFRVLRKECGKTKRVLWDNLWFIGRQQMKFTTWINDSMIKIILRMCVRDEDRIIFRTCNLTPLSQKFWIGSDRISYRWLPLSLSYYHLTQHKRDISHTRVQYDMPWHGFCFRILWHAALFNWTWFVVHM